MMLRVPKVVVKCEVYVLEINKVKSRAPGNYAYECLRGIDSEGSTESTFNRLRSEPSRNISPSSKSPTTRPPGVSRADAQIADISYSGHSGVMGIIKGDLAEEELTCDKFPWPTGNKLYPTAWCSPAAGTELKLTSNFMRIKHDTLNNYRSAVPANDKNFYRFLKKEHKIERIISLCQLSAYANRHPTRKNGFPNREGKLDKNMRKEVEEAGLEYLYVPLSTNGPSSKSWNEIKVFLGKGNTLIHCTHGADRTGAVAGRWMVEKYGISARDAYKDARIHGFKPYLHETKVGGKKRIDSNRALRYFIFTGRGVRWSHFGDKQQPEFFKQR